MGLDRVEEGDEAEPSISPAELESRAAVAGRRAAVLAGHVEEGTVAVDETLDEDAFFTTRDGTTTITNRYDLERAVPRWRKGGYEEVERYWVNRPYALVVVFHAVRENEKKYVLVEPHLTSHEEALRERLEAKLRATLEYGHGASRRRRRTSGRPLSSGPLDGS